MPTDAKIIHKANQVAMSLVYTSMHKHYTAAANALKEHCKDEVTRHYHAQHEADQKKEGTAGTSDDIPTEEEPALLEAQLETISNDEKPYKIILEDALIDYGILKDHSQESVKNMNTKCVEWSDKMLQAIVDFRHDLQIDSQFECDRQSMYDFQFINEGGLFGGYMKFLMEVLDEMNVDIESDAVNFGSFVEPSAKIYCRKLDKRVDSLLRQLEDEEKILRAAPSQVDEATTKATWAVYERHAKHQKTDFDHQKKECRRRVRGTAGQSNNDPNVFYSKLGDITEFATNSAEKWRKKLLMVHSVLIKPMEFSRAHHHEHHDRMRDEKPHEHPSADQHHSHHEKNASVPINKTDGATKHSLSSVGDAAVPDVAKGDNREGHLQSQDAITALKSTTKDEK